MHAFRGICTLIEVCVHACEIGRAPILGVLLIDGRSKHCLFACLQRGDLMKPLLPGMCCFFYDRRGGMQCVCVCKVFLIKCVVLKWKEKKRKTPQPTSENDKLCV